MNPDDKRVQRTHKKLTEALVALTLEKGYEAVTIQDITTRAGVGYRTYFRHFNDKDELLLYVLRFSVTELRNLAIFPPMDGSLSQAEAVKLNEHNSRIIFEHVGAHSDLFRVFFRSKHITLKPAFQYVRQEAYDILTTAPDSPIPPEVLAHQIASSIFAMIEWWLENDMPYPPERMGRYLTILMLNPIRQLYFNPSTIADETREQPQD